MTASIYRQTNTLLNGVFPLLLVFLFAIFSALLEILIIPARMHAQLILALLCLLAVFATGQFAKVLRTPIGQSVTVFTAWFITCIPFAIWRGGAFEVFDEYWYKSALIYLFTAGLLTTLPQANRIFHAIAYGTGLLCVVTLLKNARSSDGRLILDGTRYMNSNELAWTILVGLTFVGFLYLRGNRYQKTIALLELPPILLALSRTGSRAAMLGAGALFVATLWQADRKTRIKLMAGVPVIVLALVVLLPKDVLFRYTTFFGTYSTYDTSREEKLRISTIGSTEGRKQLLIDSLVVTMQHPLMGVGPGNFQIAQADLAASRGEGGMWHVTHNTYTQLSSEMGLPGLIIYLVFLRNVFKVLNSIIRTRDTGPAWQNLRQLALTLRSAFIVFLLVACFSSLGYTTDVPILAGLTTALGFMAQKQRAIDRLAEAQARVEAMTPADSALEPVAVGLY